MYGIILKDEEENYRTQVSVYGDDTALILLQINLCRYADGAISEVALANMDKMFAELKKIDKQFILRFLYDWDGKAMESEPENVDTILLHMEQLQPILNKYEHIIFLHQGIFVGACGEMHSSNHLSTEDMSRLMAKVAQVTPPSTYLAVRTPVQWRKITQIATPQKAMDTEVAYATRLGLYNDGMMGTEQDYGTYGYAGKAEAGDFSSWNRTEELEFQDMLCEMVPNGGEVIVDNPINDLENAIDSLATMHVTYLNRYHDVAVMDKWSQSIVEEDSCFDGMDGLTYIDRHLGYRLVIDDAALRYDFKQDTLSVDVTIKNVGFAPMYRKPDIYVVVCSKDTMERHTFQLQEDVRVLTGGNERDELLTLHKEISLNGYDEGDYSVFFYMVEETSGWHIQFGNEQEEEKYGYRIGEIRVESVDKFVDEFMEELPHNILHAIGVDS
mgnify:CR=1 FL=1